MSQIFQNCCIPFKNVANNSKMLEKVRIEISEECCNLSKMLQNFQKWCEAYDNVANVVKNVTNLLKNYTNFPKM